MRAATEIGLGVCCAFAFASSCGHEGVTVEYRDGRAWSAIERRTIERVARRASRDVRAILPELPSTLRLTVQVGDKVIPETGENAGVGLPAAVYWTVDPGHDGGVIAVVNAQLRATLFHEFYHLVREARIGQDSPFSLVISEGLATAFERDFGGAPTPWGEYPPDVAEWAAEFLTLSDGERARRMSRSPDGRRWFGYKVGTYLADRAVKISGQSLAQLATEPTDRILRWAKP